MSDEANHDNELQQRQMQVLVEEATGKRIRKLVIQRPPDPGIEEAAGKRIRRLRRGEMYAKSRQIYLG